MENLISSMDNGDTQSKLLEFEDSNNSEKITNIYANHVRKIITALKRLRKVHENAVLVFHNDSDGFCAALYIRQVLIDLKYIIEPQDFIPITHIERDKLKIDPDKIYFFLDIQPAEVSENIFCIDHHTIDKRKRYISRNMLIYLPDEMKYQFLTTAAFLSMYFYYVHKGYRYNFTRFIDDRAWWGDEFDRFVSIFAAVTDNLWLLSKYSPLETLKEWIEEVGYKERKFIKVSMGISLLLGREEGRLNGFAGFFEKSIDGLEIQSFDDLVDHISKQIDNLYRFARALDREAKTFVEEQNEEIDELIAKTRYALDRDKKTISDYTKAMPIDLKKDAGTAMEMLKTVGNADSTKWKQIEFYGKEIDRLNTHMKNLEKKLTGLLEKKEAINPDNVPGLCVFISKQNSEQVKGILSSLLYYFGQKNIVVEETEHHAIWGARGFRREELEEVLMTLSFDRHMLDAYLRIEDMSKDLPASYRRSINISNNITVEKKYVGGLGGRGLVFGGNIKGRVPQLFAMLDSSELEAKLKELVAHGELHKALKGLTEGHSQVNTVAALRTKFKSLGWVTIQVIGGSGRRDILDGDIGVPIAWLAGSNKNINLSGDLKNGLN